MGSNEVALITAAGSGMGAAAARRLAPDGFRVGVLSSSGVFRAGLAAFAKLFADRYAAENIRMKYVLPGFIDSLPEKPEFRDRIPMARYGKSDEIAATITFLASEGGGYITGQNIRVDGGITRAPADIDNDRRTGGVT